MRVTYYQCRSLGSPFTILRGQVSSSGNWAGQQKSSKVVNYKTVEFRSRDCSLQNTFYGPSFLHQKKRKNQLNKRSFEPTLDMKPNLLGSVALTITMTLSAMASAHATGSRVLHSFNGTDGNEPTWLLEGSDGTLWGVTFLGGSNGLGNGVLYKVDRRGTFTVVHNFLDTPDGSLPGKLLQASDGTIYGLTASGGTKFGGTVYKVTTTGAYSVLHSFDPSTEGSGPNHLIEASDGFFYGTTSIAGMPDRNCSNREPQGTLFRMDASGNVTALHTFCETSDGSLPNSVVEATDGLLYGTCKQDGAFGAGSGLGTFWASDKSGNVTVLHTFGPRTLNGDEPTNPNGILQGPDGLFYGVANAGGLSSEGAIFRADASGTLTTIHSFSSLAADGAGSAGRRWFFLWHGESRRSASE